MPSRCQRPLLPSLAAAFATVTATPCTAQDAAPELPAVTIRSTTPAPARIGFPATAESVTAAELAEGVNLVNTEDAFRYLPGLAVRKRNIGDPFAPLATRTSGLGQSARSLVYADGVLLSTLTGNNNSNATPRWSMVSPEEIERIDVMYGPFSAAYPGNSMGAVVEIATRMPDGPEGSVRVTTATQRYQLYGTRDSYPNSQVNALLGSRSGPLSWRLSASFLDARSQPLAITTVARPAAGSALGTPVTGAIPELNRLGAPIFVIGSGGIETKQQVNLKARVMLDITPQWRASYTVGVFQNDVDSKVDSYLRDAAGNPVYAGADINLGGYRFTGGNAIGAGAFGSSSGIYRWRQEHFSHAASLKSDTGGNWDWEAIATAFDYNDDRQRIPGTALPAAAAGGPGSIVSLNGTGWRTLDLKGLWRPAGRDGAHRVSFGLHHDLYRLENTTYATSDWIAGSPSAVNANALGKTRTDALWIQDAWRFAPGYTLTVGGRQEWWQAFDGLNLSTAPASNVVQPKLDASRFSPKASLAWDATTDWRVTASYGSAYRFPTVSELYQAVTVAGVVRTPNPNLRPEAARSTELAFERLATGSRLRVSLFQEALSDALIAQNSTIPGTNVVGSSTQNIDRVRSRGLEVAAQASNALVRGLDLSGSVTFVDSRIRSNPSFRNAAGAPTDVTGRYTPNIPKLKATAQALYRHDEHWSAALGARYSSRVWATMDNTDINPGTYQGFEGFFVADVRVNHAFDRKTRVSVGIDNLNNRKYYLFHPFPQRTVLAEVRHQF